MDTCSNCNAEMRLQASYCSRCGTKRVRADVSDTAGVVAQSNEVPLIIAIGDNGSNEPFKVVAQSNGVPPIIGFFQQMVMTPLPIARTNGNSASTGILDNSAEPASPPEEASDGSPAHPMDEDVPATPSPENLAYAALSLDTMSNQAEVVPMDDDVALMPSPEESSSNHTPAHLANGDMPDAPSLEGLVPASVSLLEGTNAADGTPSPAPSPEIPPSNDTSIEIPLLDEYEQVLDAIEYHLFEFLDKNREVENRRNLANARRNKSDVRVIGMCLHICRQVIEVYKNGQIEKYLTQDGFKFVFDLVHYVIQKSEEDVKSAADATAHQRAEGYLTNAKKYECVLETLYELRYSHFTPSDLVKRARAQFIKQQLSSSAIKALWKEIAEVVSSYLKEQRQVHTLMPEVARSWVEEYKAIDMIDEEIDKTVTNAAQQHVPEALNPLCFLSRPEQASLLDQLRHAGLKQISRLLGNRKSELLQALSEVLADPHFDLLLEPRRSIPVVSPYGGVELIPEIRRLMASQSERAPWQALRLLEQSEENNFDPDYAPVLREWRLYVKANTRGWSEAIDEWQKDVRDGVASWEEIWNLAVALKGFDMARSLRALRPGVESQRAPFSHLRLALFCAVTMLQEAAGDPKAAIAEVETFLLHTLLKLPSPLAYLTWFFLAQQASEAIDFKRQLSELKVLRYLLDHALMYTPPAHPAREISIEDFTTEFQGFLTLTQKLEHDYVFEPPQKSVMLKNNTLGTVIRLSQYIPLRVGIFVDYENLILSLPVTMHNQSEMIAATLLKHAASYGNVVARRVCYSPTNIKNGNAQDVQIAFQKAGFKLEVPRGLVEKRFDPEEKRNQADSVLIESLSTAARESKLDVYLIVSGDHIYYERIRSLLEEGSAVRIVSHPKKRAGIYERLQKSIQHSLMSEEYGEFGLDDLQKIFQLTAEEKDALNAEIQARSEKDALNAEIQARNNKP